MSFLLQGLLFYKVWLCQMVLEFQFFTNQPTSNTIGSTIWLWTCTTKLARKILGDVNQSMAKGDKASGMDQWWNDLLSTLAYIPVKNSEGFKERECGLGRKSPPPTWLSTETQVPALWPSARSSFGGKALWSIKHKGKKAIWEKENKKNYNQKKLAKERKWERNHSISNCVHGRWKSQHTSIFFCPHGKAHWAWGLKFGGIRVMAPNTMTNTCCCCGIKSHNCRRKQRAHSALECQLQLRRKGNKYVHTTSGV